MIALDIIKQTIEGNTQKPAISSNIIKKIAMSKINTSISINCDWQLKDGLSYILSLKLPDEDKADLLENLKTLAYETYNKMKSDLNSLFGEEKQASVEVDKQSDEKEEIAKAPEGNSEEEAQDDPKDEKKTPAEHVIEQKPGQSIFNY